MFYFVWGPSQWGWGGWTVGAFWTSCRGFRRPSPYMHRVTGPQTRAHTQVTQPLTRSDTHTNSQRPVCSLGADLDADGGKSARSALAGGGHAALRAHTQTQPRARTSSGRVTDLHLLLGQLPRRDLVLHLVRQHLRPRSPPPASTPPPAPLPLFRVSIPPAARHHGLGAEGSYGDGCCPFTFAGRPARRRCTTRAAAAGEGPGTPG